MIKNLKDTLPIEKQYTYVFQGLHMFNSILKGATRVVNNNNNNIGFHAMNSYLYCNSNFVCEEDYKIYIPDFKTYLLDKKKTEPQNEGIDYYLSALQNVGNISLNIREVRIYLAENFKIQGKVWPQGVNVDAAQIILVLAYIGMRFAFGITNSVNNVSIVGVLRVASQPVAREIQLNGIG